MSSRGAGRRFRLHRIVDSGLNQKLYDTIIHNWPEVLEDVVVSRLAMRSSLERFDLAVGRCVAAVAGEGTRGPDCSAPGWATRGRSTRLAAIAAAALVAADVTTAAVEVWSRWSAETGTDLRNVR